MSRKIEPSNKVLRAARADGPTLMTIRRMYMETLAAVTKLLVVLNSNHFAAVVLIALFAIHRGPPKG